MTKWQCPECGRQFARARQNHSCQRSTVETHLEKGSPEVIATFRALKKVLDRLGAEIVPTKTSMMVFATTAFAGIRVRREVLLVEFLLARELSDPRLSKIERLSPTRIAHHVPLRAVRDVDKQLKEWLTESYALGMRHR